ncbi:MAG TPA: LPXTG cell wall anchor domain-containing protein [Candidatus Limosilactobacillus faecipullorum]|nr:LPXTG cell wall anchor domain-containing protein [Candidatus Limosilactobacillus faecipullorum]
MECYKLAIDVIGTIESPTFYFVLPTGFYYNPTKYGDNWVATDEKQYQTTTTYYANGHQVIKVAFQTGHTFVGTGNAGQVQFILNVSADSTVVPGEYKVMSYISSPNVKWANMASLTNTDLSYLDVDANASDTGKSKSFANRKTDYVTLTVSNVAKSLNNNSGIAIDGEDGILSAVTTNGQVDDRGDGKTTLGMNVYSTQAETTGFVYKGALPVNDITGKQDIVLTGPVTIPSSISDTVSILYATGDVDLNNIETTNYVTANKITDWSKVTGVALIGTKIATGVHAQVNLPVQVLNVSDKSGKKYKFNTALFKNSLPNQPLDMTATLTVTGKSTIKTRVEYTDTDGTTKYKDLEYTKTYTDGEDTPKASDFPSSTGDTSALAQYSPTFSLDDQNTLKDLLQNRIMPNDPNMGSINLRSTVTPSEDGYYVTYVLADKTETTTNTKNFTRTINIKKPDGATETVAQTAPIGQQVTKDLITGKTTTYPWGTSYWQSYTIPVVNGYIGKADTTDGKIDPQKIDENSSDTIVNITYTKLGSILPVDESDNSLGSNTTYANDPDDGSKAATTNAPTIPGYHVASTQTNSNITVSGSGNNTTATVTPVDQTQNTQVVYEPNTETATVKFIDNDNSSQEISGTAITSTGKYGQTITFTINPETELKTLEARGYELVSDDWADKINSTYKDGNNIFEIHLKHQIKQFVPANPTKGADDSNNIYHDPVNGKDYPAFEAAALTVTYTGAGDATPKAQTITVPGAFYKNFTYDAVTGAVVSEDSNWTSTNKPSSTSSNFAFDSSIYEAYENGGYGNNDNRKLIPSIIGYKAGYKNGPFIATLPLIQLGANAGGNTVTYTYSIIYTANDETAMIKFIDDTTGKAVSDSALNTDGALTTTGKYGETISFTTDPETELANLEKKGYTLVSDGWKNKTSTTYQDGDVNNTFEIHLKHLYAADLVSKSVTRTINYVDAKDTSKPVADAVKQRATLTRNHIKDNVTGDYVGYGSIDDNSDYVSNDAWNVENQTWVAVASPDLSAKGYEAPDQTKVDAVTVDGNTQDATITVTYDHKTVTVQPNNPKTTTDPLPDNPTSNYPSGVDEKDLKKTITRTIKLTTPNGKETDETQTVTLSRTATVDEVNGGVTYSYWSTGTWDSYTPKSVTGYTPKITIDDTSASSIAQTTVSHDTNDSTVIITYTPDSQKLQIHIYDVDKNATIKDDLGAGESGVTLEIDGVSNQAYDETSAVQKLEDYYKGLGYKLAPVTAEHPLPVATGTFDTNDAVDQAINIYLVHDIEEQTQKVTRTINYQTTETHKQVAGPYTKTVTVIAMVDRVTGNALSYTGTDGTSAVTVTLTGTKTKDGKNAYTITIPGQKLPTYAGYTAQAPEATSSTQAKIFNETLSGTDDSLTETVNYTPNDQQLQIRVFDDTTDPDSKTDLGAGQSGDQVNFSGKTDETVPDDVKAKVDDLIKYYEGKGYVLVSTGTIPTKYDNTDNTGDTDSAVQHVDIHLKHGTKTITATQTNITYTDPTNNQQYQLTYDATRTITYQGAGNQTPAEKAETVRGAFTRQLTVDAVTGKVQTVDLWTGSYDYASVSVTPVTGYVADKVTVPAVTASADNLDENGNPKAVSQTVAYTAVGRIIPVDANGKQLADPQNYKNDSADPTKVAENETLPMIPGYHIVSGDGVTTSGTGNNTTGTITPTNATSDTKVTYAPNAETITVKYVDADAKDPSKATLKTDPLNGDFGTDINYTTKDELAKLTNEGYVLSQASDDGFTSANQTQYTVENDGKTYIVTLHHGTETVTTNQQVDGKTKINENDDRDNAPVWTDENGIVSAAFTRTISYVASDGTNLGLSTQTQSAHWTRELTVDKVTGEVVDSTAWTTTNTYPAVTSPTVAGYTPDIATVAEVTSPKQTDTKVTVTYAPNDQKLHIRVFDDTVDATKDIGAGDSNQTVDYTGKTNTSFDESDSVSALEKYYEGKGYILDPKSPAPTTTGTYNTDDNDVQYIDIHLIHNTHQQSQTVIRTINYVTTTKDADGQPVQVATPTTVTVTVKATIDDVTKDASDYTATDSNGKSYTVTRTSTVTNGGSNQYSVTLPGQTTLPTKEGYTAAPTSAATAKSDQTYTVTLAETVSDHSETVTYTPNAQDLTIVVHDNTTNTDVDVSTYGDSTSFTGVSDGNVSTDVTTNRDKLIQQLKDKGYDVTDEGNIPANYDHDDSNDQTVTIRVTHKKVTVTPDKPKTTDDTIDGTTQKYPDGVSESDLNHTVTRTINVTNPDGTTQQAVQTVAFIREATIDAVTGHVTYTPWVVKGTTATQGTWSEYDGPTHAGYTPAIDGKSADSATISANDQVSESDSDQTINITYTANPQSTKIQYVDDDAKDVQGNSTVVTLTDLTGETDEKVNPTYVTPTGYELVDSNQEVPSYTFKASDNQPIVVHLRHKTVKVDSFVPKTLSDKLPDNPGKDFPSGVGESDLNKTITRTINVTKPDGMKITTTQTVHLTRTATVDEVTGEVTYSDWTTGKWDAYTPDNVAGYTPNGTAPKSPVNGNSQDQTINITYIANPQKVTINYVDDDDQGKVVHTTPLSGKTDRTVPVTNEVPAGYQLATGSTVPSDHTFTPDGPATITVHLVHKHDQDSENHQATRTITVTTPDGMTQTITQTGKISRSTDTDEVTKTTTYGDWSKADWPKYDVPVIPGYTASVKTVDETPLTPNTQDSQVVITYTANAQATTIQYVDDDEGDQVVNTTVLNGQTGQTVTPAYTIPDHYDYVGGEEANYTFKASGNVPIVVHLKHHHTTTPDQKTVTRTITVTTPAGKKTTTTQTATSTRMIDTDEVTGTKTPGAWQPATWDNFATPTIAGYVPTVSQVAAKKVTGDTPDEQINIAYSANPQTATVTYVDDETSKTVHVTNLHGDTATTVTVPNEVPAGYDLVGTFPSDYTFTSASQQGITVHLKHHPNTVPETKTVTRTITVVNPNGTTKTVTQTATITRQVTTDAVNGNQTFTPWTIALWSKFEVPTFKGYTPSQITVTPVTVDGNSQDETVTITYAADPAAIVYFLDEDQLDAKGQPSQVATSGYLSGNFNGPIIDQSYAKTLADLQAKGYLLDNQKSTYPTQDKFDTDPKTLQTFYVYLKHQTTTAPEQKTATRTIKVNNPAGTTKTITQTVAISRQITIDKVTGKQTAGDWSSANWAEFKVPAISGYTPSQTTVPVTTVDGTATDQTVTINYTANPQTVTIKYIDDTTGTTVKAESVQGVTDQTVTIPADVPSGYRVVGQLPGKYTLTSDDGQTITVHLTHQTTTVAEAKTITRTITVINPNGMTKTVTQTATITRQVTTDQATGTQTFTPWSAADWPAFNLTNLAVIPGYTPMVVKGSTAHVMVDETTQDAQTQIIYVGQPQGTTIQYVDDETGKVVQTTSLQGRTGETVTPSYQTLSGYDLVDPSQAVTSYIFKTSGNQPIVIHLTHHKSIVPETKTVTRTITVVNPNGTTKTVTQTATITRQVTTDQVTGDQTATAWTTVEWPAFNVPTLTGYTANIDGTIDAVTVDATTTDQVVTITYLKQTTPNKPVVIPDKPNKPNRPTVNPTLIEPTNGNDQTSSRSTSDTPVKPSISGQSSAVISQGTVRPTKATVTNIPTATTGTSRLPQTGNANSRAMLSLGLASLVATLGLLIEKKREDRK